MQTYIEQLKKKPEHHRRKIALGVSGVFTAFVFVIWLSVLMPRGNGSVVAKSETVKKSQSDSPISTLKNGVAQVLSAFKENFNKVGESINLNEEYNNMKGQVENGEIKLVPTDNNQ